MEVSSFYILTCPEIVYNYISLSYTQVTTVMAML